MRASGFANMDVFGKEVALKAAYKKATKAMLTEAGQKNFIAKHKRAWGNEVYTLANDLKRGEVTEPVRTYLFAELSRMQPISKMEMAEKYLTNPNGRIFYMMKSFMLKQIDLIRRDSVELVKNPATRARGLKNLASIILALGAGGTTSSVIQEFMKGNTNALDDVDPETFVGNAVKTFGWSEYTINKALSGKPLEAAGGIIAPPYAIFDQIWKQEKGETVVSEKAWKLVPVAGKTMYYWFEGGLEKELAAKKKREEKEK